MSVDSKDFDVLIIGAGPAGAMAAANLVRRGRRVRVIERATFPRFSIGESLLPQSMELLEEAGLLRPVVEGGFQYKNGAAFARGDQYTAFDFRDKSSKGWSTTYQVERATFDKLVADAAAAMGAEFQYGQQVKGVDFGSTGVRVTHCGDDGVQVESTGRFILDASGLGRVLPRLLALETPSSFPVRQAMFTHVSDRIAEDAGFDRSKIRVTTHPQHVDVWYWLIPFSGGRASLGVVADKTFFDGRSEGDTTEQLKAIHWEDPGLQKLLAEATWDTPARKIVGYAANVKALHGPGFALLGNAGEFLDPVFSSGVTIAFKSASLAAALVHRQLGGEAVDWSAEFENPIRQGVDVFRAFVESWYGGGFQNVIFYKRQQPEVRRMLCSILAGYAWDRQNPYVVEPRRLKVLEEICAG